ncbi:unnamed protein product [Pseudo-nitzschia multistriata]|uniref:Uncharacterized protein n=1 Tax=Pseudo-nitzschia multistriata TaxID=183589 RepID=A0A448ZSB7_9STRA|nr:unnamed protein product [Pseudo-nitzschia multistriata]
MSSGTLSRDGSAESSASTTAPRRRRKRPLTNTNTDKLCQNGSVLSKWIYRFNLWTGLYMLNPYERFVFHLVGWFSFTVSLLYVYVFWKGFIEGFRHST